MRNKVTQIISSNNRMYALTEDGEIFEYFPSPKKWQMLPLIRVENIIKYEEDEQIGVIQSENPLERKKRMAKESEEKIWKNV